MKKPSRSLTLRVVSSLVLIPIFVAMTVTGGWVFATLIALCIAIAFAEWINIVGRIPKSRLFQTFLIVVGVFYLGGSFLEMMMLRLQTDGVYWVIVFMMAIWASDTLAYILGKNIGGPKMTPTISPNKTWSGYAGALLGPAIVLTLCIHYIPQDDFKAEHISPDMTFFAGMMIGIAGQSGDLLISWMKRTAGVKDTGALIPGHGGILDRIDALLMAFPVFLAYAKFVTE